MNSNIIELGNHLTPLEIQNKLKLSKKRTYVLINSGKFPIVRIGKSIRIPEKPFIEWLDKGGDAA